MLPQPPDGYLKEADADSQLQAFVYAGKYDAPTLPKRADPRHVEKFLRKRFEDEKIKPKQLARVGDLLRFFDLRSLCDVVAKAMLTKREAGPETFAGPLYAITILGDMGDPAQRKQAAQYHAHLVAHRSAPPNFRPLIDALFYCLEADPSSVKASIDARRKALEPKIQTDDLAEVEYHELEDLQNSRLVAVQNGRKRKQQILEFTPERRLEEISRCYIGRANMPLVEFEPWGAMSLQRTANAASPAEPAAALSKEFDLLAIRIASPGGLTPPEQEDMKKFVTRCRRAIEFYKGKLTAEQAQTAEKQNNPDQYDLLFWEPAAAPAPQGA